MQSITLLALVLTVQSVKLPPNFQKCDRKQPDLNQCVLRAAQHGLSQLTKPFRNVNLPSLDPLHIPGVSIKAGQGKVAINQDLHNCSIYGFDKMKLDQYEFGFVEKTLQVKGVFPKIIIQCRYKLDGEVLLLPIKGQGPATVILEMKILNILSFEEVRKSGKTHIKFVKSELEMDPSLVHYNFENLFNGDKVLSDNINGVLNDNWKEVFDEMKKDYTETVNRILIGLLNGFFAKVSIEEAFD
ncbi:protein takeout-like isoform X2 [Tenebrio molitor]|uniref:protein takeout-like isoform X2 n=1 Tax=Tenebrio molitor TaxID=7067 RepID=UPI00362496E0